jgi:hypothetical protein
VTHGTQNSSRIAANTYSGATRLPARCDHHSDCPTFNEQVIERTGYGKYSIVSVPRFIRNLRGHGSGPAALSTAKSNLAIEKAALAKLDRQEREGSLVPIAEVAAVYARTFTAIKSRALALPSKIASRLAFTDLLSHTRSYRERIRSGLEPLPAPAPALSRGNGRDQQHAATA